MIGNNFGLFASTRRAEWLLRRLHNMTTDGARIIAGSRDPYADPTPQSRRYRALNRKRARLPGQLRTRVRYDEFATQWFDYLVVSKAEMKSILWGTGWHVSTFLETDSPSYVSIIEKDQG
jgi:hypothetical protein